MELNFQRYQEKAASTALPVSDHIMYNALALACEAGEVAGKVSKVLRDSDGEYSPLWVSSLLPELGDVLWHLSELCRASNLTLTQVAEYNLAKLADRQRRNVLQGSGDDR